jgi:uncharacterized membrane protein
MRGWCRSAATVAELQNFVNLFTSIRRRHELDALERESRERRYTKPAGCPAAVTLGTALCVVFVFLALAAQYESWSLPLAVILIVPMCLMSAMTGVLIRGQDNNISPKSVSRFGIPERDWFGML